MEQMFWHGKNGQLFPAIIKSLEELRKYHQTPLVEIDSESCFWPRNTGCFMGDIKHAYAMICSYYKQWQKYGPDGDIISVIRVRDMYQINFIGRLAYHKPGLSADLVPFIRDSEGSLFFIGITRKKDPGAGKHALIGGFRNVKGYHFASGAETIISEGNEETGLKVIPYHDGVYHDVKHIINLKEFHANVVIDDIVQETDVKLIGVYPTSAEEKMVTGLKRVYETTAYGFVVDVHEKLSVESLKKRLSAGDDAEDIVVWNLTESDKMPVFYFSHHSEIFYDAINLILAGK